MPTSAHLSPTEARIFALLEDGYPHTRREIFERCLDDDLAAPASAVARHICSIRKKLRGSGEDISLSIVTRVVSYRRVLLMGKAKTDAMIEQEALVDANES